MSMEGPVPIPIPIPVPVLPYSTIGADGLPPIDFVQSSDALTISIKNAYARELVWLGNLMCTGCVLAAMASLVLLLLNVQLDWFGFVSLLLVLVCGVCVFYLPRLIRIRAEFRQWGHINSFIRISKHTLEIYSSGTRPKRTRSWPIKQVVSIGWVAYELPLVGLQYISLRVRSRVPVLLFPNRETLIWMVWPPGTTDPDVLQRFDAALLEAAKWCD